MIRLPMRIDEHEPATTTTSQYTFVATTYSNNEITWCDKSC